MLSQQTIHIIATQLRVPGGREHLKHAVAHLKHRDIEGAAAEVVNGNLLLLLQLVQTVGQGRCRWLGQNALDGEAGKLAARLVAARWASLKNAGTVMTARVMVVTIAFSAMVSRCFKISAETSTGERPSARRS